VGGAHALAQSPDPIAYSPADSAHEGETMADDGEREQRQQSPDESGEGGKDRQEDVDESASRDPSFRAYLKLFGTILISLLLFAAIMRGCAACQDKNPLTGEPTEQQAPAPPPPPPAPPPEPEK
jgi:hypothetical protein